MKYWGCNLLILILLISCGGSDHSEATPEEPTIIPVENGRHYSKQCTALFARNNIDLICENVEECDGFPCLVVTDESLGYNQEGFRVVGICHYTGLLEVTTYKRTDEEVSETMAHEIGHLFGLPHHTDCNNIMTTDADCVDVRVNFTQAQIEYFP